MINKNKKWGIKLIIMLMSVLILAGCGTTLSDEDSDDAAELIVVQTTQIDEDKAIVNDAATNVLLSTDIEAAEANALIEVYNSYPFDNPLASGYADNDGTFYIELGTDDDDIAVLYVFATAPGKSASDWISFVN